MNSQSPAEQNSFQIIMLDYHNEQHGKDLIHLLNIYAQDPMGGGKQLPIAVTQQLCAKLAEINGAFSLIAYSEHQACGLITCFEGFSTFSAKTLINVHDLMVVPEFRGQGISLLLLQEVEHIAKQRDCCKITLEVLQGNIRAQKTYKKFGFSAYELDPQIGQALFWEKSLKLNK